MIKSKVEIECRTILDGKLHYVTPEKRMMYGNVFTGRFIRTMGNKKQVHETSDGIFYYEIHIKTIAGRLSGAAAAAFLEKL